MARERLELLIPKEFIDRNPQFANYMTDFTIQSQAVDAWLKESKTRFDSAEAERMTRQAEEIEIDNKLKKVELQDRLRSALADNAELNAKLDVAEERLAAIKADATTAKAIHEAYATVIRSGEMQGREEMAIALLESDMSAASAIDILAVSPRATRKDEVLSAQEKAILALANSAPIVGLDMDADEHAEAQAGGVDREAIAAARRYGQTQRLATTGSF